tara:strand:- start:63 stop:791 length:729 start_codon:yes stop_codon:yes gene_type:complete
MKNIFLFTGYDRTDLIEFFLKNNHQIIAIISPYSSKYVKNMKNLYSLAIKESIPILNIKSVSKPYYEKIVKDALLYSSGYPYLIKESVYKKFKYALNCHPSLLPKNRGKYLEYIFLNNEEISGTSVHHIRKGCDDGPIILQKSFKVELEDNVDSLKIKSKKLELDLLKEIFEKELYKNSGVPQKEEHATCYLQSRNPDDSEVPNYLSLSDAYLISRAFNQDIYPGFFKYKGKKIYFKMELSD